MSKSISADLGDLDYFTKFFMENRIYIYIDELYIFFKARKLAKLRKYVKAPQKLRAGREKKLCCFCFYKALQTHH